MIENQKGKAWSRAELAAREQGTSWKAQIQDTIDRIIPTVADFGEFVEAMEGAGVKVGGSMHISYQLEGQERRTRGNKIGSGYTREGIMARIYAEKSNVIHFVTMSSKLVREGETRYFTRIPYTQEYVHIDRERASWVDRNKTLGVFLFEDREYTICDREGRPLRAVSGADLISHYDDKTRRAEPEPVPQDITTWITRITRRERIENIKGLAGILSTMDREGVRDFKDVFDGIYRLGVQIGDIRTEELAALETKETALREAAGLMVTYEKLKPVVETVQGASVFKRRRLEAKHEDDLRAFSHADEGLRALGLDPTVTDGEQLISGLRAIQEAKDEVKNRISGLEQRREALKAARDMVMTLRNEDRGHPTRRTRDIGR